MRMFNWLMFQDILHLLFSDTDVSGFREVQKVKRMIMIIEIPIVTDLGNGLVVGESTF